MCAHLAARQLAERGDNHPSVGRLFGVVRALGWRQGDARAAAVVGSQQPGRTHTAQGTRELAQPPARRRSTAHPSPGAACRWRARRGTAGTCAWPFGCCRGDRSDGMLGAAAGGPGQSCGHRRARNAAQGDSTRERGAAHTYPHTSTAGRAALTCRQSACPGPPTCQSLCWRRPGGAPPLGATAPARLAGGRGGWDGWGVGDRRLRSARAAVPHEPVSQRSRKPAPTATCAPQPCSCPATQ